MFVEVEGMGQEDTNLVSRSYSFKQRTSMCGNCVRRAEDLAPDLERLQRGDGKKCEGSCNIIFI
jgi:hypothetical protein